MKLPLAGACAAFALGAAGCGSGALPPQQIPGASENLLTAAAVDRYADDSPEHALLEWWRASQFADGPAFVGGFAPPLRKRLAGDPQLGEELDYFAGSIRNAAPKVLTTEVDGDRARVFTKIEYRNAVGATRFVVSTRPQAFELTRDGQRWLLADDTFLRAILAHRVAG